MSHYISETLTNASQTSAAIDWLGGPGTFGAIGTWATGTIQLQFSIDGGTNWADVPGAELTLSSDGLGNFQLFPCKLRVDTTNTPGAQISVKIRVAPAIPGWVLGTDL